MCVQILTDHRVQHGWCSRSDGVDVCHRDLFVYLFLCSLTEVRCLIGGYQAGTGTTQSGPSYIRSTRPLLMRRTKSSITYLWQEFVFTQTHNWVWGRGAGDDHAGSYIAPPYGPIYHVSFGHRKRLKNVMTSCKTWIRFIFLMWNVKPRPPTNRAQTNVYRWFPAEYVLLVMKLPPVWTLAEKNGGVQTNVVVVSSVKVVCDFMLCCR